MRLFPIVLLLLVLPLGAGAQEPPPLVSGGDIRLWAPSLGLFRERGSFVSWGSGNISMVPTESGDPLDVPLDAVTRLDVLEGRSRLKGAATWGGILGAVGFIVGLAMKDCESWDDLCSSWVGGMYYGGSGMLVGGAVGALVGSQLPQDVWVRQELPEGR